MNNNFWCKFKQYSFNLKLFIRFLLKLKYQVFINILGLTSGLAAGLLIFLYIVDEISYDKHWNDSELIYRINTKIESEEKEDRYVYTSMAVLPELMQADTNIKTGVRLIKYPAQPVKIKDLTLIVDGIYWADSTFFDIFNKEFIYGNCKEFNDSGKVFISEEIAVELYGNVNPVGKSFKTLSKKYVVAGVFRNEGKSHLDYNIIASLKQIPDSAMTDMRNDYTYLRVQSFFKFKNKDAYYKFYEKKNRWILENVIPWRNKYNVENIVDFDIINIEKIHFNNDYQYDSKTNVSLILIYLFGIVGFFIILIACINYMNLSTATSIPRGKEIAVRKVSGADRTDIIKQFYFETSLLAIMAFLFSLMIVEIVLPEFNQLVDKDLSIPGMWLETLLFAVVVLPFTVLISGSYPALYLASLYPLQILRTGTFNFDNLPGLLQKFSVIKIRKVLVVIQYSISILLITATFIVIRQINFMKNVDLGFNGDKVLVLNCPTDTSYSDLKLKLKEQLNLKNYTQGVSLSRSLPGIKGGQVNFYYTGEHDSVYQNIINIYAVDDKFAELLEIDLNKGRFFDSSLKNETENAVVINEAAAEFMGVQNIDTFEIASSIGVNGKVVGILENFNYMSLHEKVNPLILVYDSGDMGRYLLVKLKDKNDDVIKDIQKTWSDFFPVYPLEFFELKTFFNKQYGGERRLLLVIGSFAILAIIISTLGVFGLSVFSIERRLKELAVRKIFGASFISLFLVVFKEYLILVLISLLISFPIGYVLLEIWLTNFSLSANIGILPFLYAGAIAITTALISVGLYFLNITNRKTTEILKYE